MSKCKNIRVLLSNAPWYSVDLLNQTGRLGCRAGSRWPHMRDYKGSMISRYQPFPFFLATASAMLKADGFDVLIHDSIVIGETYEKFFTYLQIENPDVVVLEVSTPSIYNDLKIIGHIKEIFPCVQTIVCGLHAPIATEQFLIDNSTIDFAIYGEYEHPLLMLMHEIRNGNYQNVPNLVYRKNGFVYKTKREQLVPLSKLPWPDRDALPTTYYDGCGGMIGKELQLHTSRGCPYRCNFCVLPQIMYFGKYRVRDPHDVIDEIIWNFEKTPYTHFYFDDDTINADRQHFLSLCRLIKQNGLSKIPWSCMGRGDLMDEEMLIALKEAGCFSIKYGMESFSRDVIDQSGKRLDIDKNVENIKKTEELGIKVHLTYCLGLLGDTRETVNDTIKKSLELRADSRQYSIAMPFPGSELWKEYDMRGLLSTNDLSQYDANHDAVINSPDLSSDELIMLKKEAERLNRRQIINMVTSQYRTKTFEHRFRECLTKYKNPIVLGTCKQAVGNYLYKLAKEICGKADFLYDYEFEDDSEMSKQNAAMSYLMIDSMVNVKMTRELKKMKEKQYDVVIVPIKTFTTEGSEDILKFAKEISKNIVVIYGHAKIEIMRYSGEAI